MNTQDDPTTESTAETELADEPTRDDEPITPPLRSQIPFAVGTDGRYFINVNALDAIKPADLAGRPLFIGAELTHDESRLAAELLENAAHELRARIAGALLKTRAPQPTNSLQSGDGSPSAPDE